MMGSGSFCKNEAVSEEICLKWRKFIPQFLFSQIFVKILLTIFSLNAIVIVVFDV